mmetsp:Transcript_1230/g.1279  ORF Transcript_1230/g.1279 Transcript_1230/m.1279 type:complete len:85 (-) Transcript_1230:150-404(-)
MLCNVHNTQFPVIFQSDYWPMIFAALHGISNGYVASLCMMYGPVSLESGDVALGSTVMLVFLTAGIVSGSAFAFLVILISTRMW